MKLSLDIIAILLEIIATCVGFFQLYNMFFKDQCINQFRQWQKRSDDPIFFWMNVLMGLFATILMAVILVETIWSVVENW
jgi:hypothetical protein